MARKKKNNPEQDPKPDQVDEALDAFEDRTIASAIVLMMLTGCRKTEALTATWDPFLESVLLFGPAASFSLLTAMAWSDSLIGAANLRNDMMIYLRPRTSC